MYLWKLGYVEQRGYNKYKRTTHKVLLEDHKKRNIKNIYLSDYILYKFPLVNLKRINNDYITTYDEKLICWMT